MSVSSLRWRFDEEEEEETKKQAKPEDALAERFLKTRTILLTGEIDKDQGEKVIRQLLLLEGQSAAKPINLLIDSPGGDVDAGFAIFDMIRFVKPELRILGMGLVASAAALVLLAVPRERRFGLPNSHYLIHQPLSGIRGVATEIEIHARELEKTRERINRIIAAETGQTIERIQKDTDRDYWMNADEALSYGLISKIGARRAELGL